MEPPGGSQASVMDEVVVAATRRFPTARIFGRGVGVDVGVDDGVAVGVNVKVDAGVDPSVYGGESDDRTVAAASSNLKFDHAPLGRSSAMARTV